MKKLLMGLVVGLSLGSAAMADCHDFASFNGRWNAGAQGIPFVPTVASTYGTVKISGTSSSTCSKKTKKSSFYLQQQKFVAVNIDNLSEQIAQGGGPHLQSLSALLGCPASDYPALAGMARRDFARLFPSAKIEPEALLARLKDDISHDPRLSDSCVYP